MKKKTELAAAKKQKVEKEAHAEQAIEEEHTATKEELSKEEIDEGDDHDEEQKETTCKRISSRLKMKGNFTTWLNSCDDESYFVPIPVKL